MSKPQAEDRRLQIMDAALPIFAEKGFKGATNRDIAQAAGIAPGLIYWYFKSKEDLFNAILDEFLPFGQMAIPLETMTEVPPRQLLPLMARGISGIFDQPRVLLILRILIAESMRLPETGERFNTAIKRMLDPLSIYIAAQQQTGLLRAGDPLLMAQMFLSSIGIFFIRRRIGQDATLLEYDIDQMAAFVVDAFLRAFTP